MIGCLTFFFVTELGYDDVSFLVHIDHKIDPVCINVGHIWTLFGNIAHLHNFLKDQCQRVQSLVAM